ncbi:hypothetical protein U1839_26605 [Sphingomonas sp. RT2P30]|uniref:hypothetical protein n=1 Tax=Parasphingomonas halimpatiens TaxID=3096162 RepID=UPI002FC99E6D
MSGVGNELRISPLSEQAEKSDEVLVGVAGSPSKCTNYNINCIAFSVEVSFKSLRHSAKTEKILVIDSNINEESIENCCEKGKRYLIFLSKRADGYYQANNGLNSIIELR